jgi:hypothetical protein
MILLLKRCWSAAATESFRQLNCGLRNQRMKITEAAIPGMLIVEWKMYRFFLETFEKQRYVESGDGRLRAE